MNLIINRQPLFGIVKIITYICCYKHVNLILLSCIETGEKTPHIFKN